MINGGKMIKLTNVSKVYGEGESAVHALKNITLDIPDSKLVSIIGKSGSGKSTLINLIGALDTPTEGEISNDDYRLTKLTSDELAEYRNKNVGFIFQSFYLEPYFTVMENVEMPLLIAGVDKKERREKAQVLIDKFGLSDKTDKKANQLSGGQKQRASIARALIHEPKLILADEPTGSLDIKNGEEVIAALREISAEGRTVILVTHNIEDAKKADYIIELADGEVVRTVDKSRGETL